MTPADLLPLGVREDLRRAVASLAAVAYDRPLVEFELLGPAPPAADDVVVGRCGDVTVREASLDRALLALAIQLLVRIGRHVREGDGCAVCARWPDGRAPDLGAVQREAARAVSRATAAYTEAP